MDKPEFPALTDVFDTAEGSAILATACNDDETARFLREKVTLASAELAALIAERDELLAVVKVSASELLWDTKTDSFAPNPAKRYLDAKAKEKERGEK